MLKKVIKTLILILLVYESWCGSKEYILNSSKCKVPDLEPFNEEITNIMIPQAYVSCNTTELLTFVKKNEDNSAVLYVREDLISQNTTCCYSYVTRKGSAEEPDVGIEISPCQNFEKQVLLTQDTIKVSCSENGTEKLIYENVHHVVLLKDSVREKLKLKNETKAFSVLFIVVDSVSRLNFIRTMRESYQFLKDNSFIEMKGYTKVADNTYPNYMSLLTGFSQRRMYRRCKFYEVGGLDNCPMIWYDYRDKGYITAYAEDDTPISTFNWKKKGFKDPPTDYYFKPYIEASETLRIRYSNFMPYCTGPESAGERILHLAKDFALTFKNQSTFGIFWMNTFSHNDINAPYSMDTKMKEFFAILKKEGVLDESIVFVLSDHGIRFGDIRKTLTGWSEERMPVNMISVPKRFQERFENEYNHLKKNSNKLTSTYDIFMTLQHILSLSGISYRSRQSLACPKCESLFKKIPTSRSCEDAGIPSEWCTCTGHLQEINKTDEHVKNVTRMALEKIHWQVAPYQENCEKFSLKKILFGSISEQLRHDPDMRYSFVVFETVPPATFLVTVKLNQTVSYNSTFYIRRINNLDFCIRRQSLPHL